MLAGEPEHAVETSGETDEFCEGLGSQISLNECTGSFN